MEAKRIVWHLGKTLYLLFLLRVKEDCHLHVCAIHLKPEPELKTPARAN